MLIFAIVFNLLKMGYSFFNISVYLSHPSVAGNSQNPFILSDNVVLKMPANKSFQDVFRHDKITVNQSSDGNTQHPAEAAGHPAEATGHPAEATRRFAEATGHLAEATRRFAEASRQLSEATKHPVEATGHPAEATDHTVAATKCTFIRNNSPIILSRFVKHSINN